MAVLTSVASWAGLGFITRCYALGIQRRPVLQNLGGHAGFMVAFGAIGYWMYGLEGRQVELIAKKKEQILENRKRMSEMLERRNGGGGGGEGEEEAE